MTASGPMAHQAAQKRGMQQQYTSDMRGLRKRPEPAGQKKNCVESIGCAVRA